MKYLLTLTLSIFCFVSLTAQDKDSLILEDVQTLKKTIQAIQYQIKANQEGETGKLNEIKYQSDSTLNRMDQISRKLATTSDSIQKSAQIHSNQIEREIRTLTKITGIRAIIHYILHGIAIVLIGFLMFFLRKEKKNSIEYLVQEAEKHSVQNNEIIEKAGELGKIKDRMKKVLKQQKKIRKKKK